MLRSRAQRFVLVSLVPLLILGCGKLEGETNNTETSAATGDLLVQLAVSGTNVEAEGGEEIGAVNVTVSEVTIFPAEGGTGLPAAGTIGPVTLLSGPISFDLLSLAGSPATLATGPVPVADYIRLRVVVAGASMTLQNGETHTLEVENGAVERGIDVHVAEGESTSVAVIINVRESLRLNRSNNGSFRPQISVSD